MGKISKNELSNSLKLEIEEIDLKANISDLETTNSQLAQLTNPNLLVNGDFQVWQRGTEFNNLPTTFGTYTADRWAVYSDKAGVTVADNATTYFNGITPPASGLRLQVPSGNGVCFLMHKMEVPQILRGKTVTISCLIKSSNFSPVQDHAIMVCNGNNVNNLIAASPVEFSSNFPTKSTLTFRVPDVVTDNVLNILIGRSVNSSSDLDRTVYYVKLELGSTATPLAPKSYAEELASCQRYYVPFALGNATQIETDRIYFTCSLPSQLRTSPTIGVSTVNDINGGFPQAGFVSSTFNVFATGFSVSSTKTAHGLTNPVIIVEGIDAEIY